MTEILAPSLVLLGRLSKLFEWYATGQYALKEVAQKARDAGFIYRRTGTSVPVSAVHSILRNRLYTGQFEWNGKLFQGRHQPLVSAELWGRVQGVLDGRNANKSKRGQARFRLLRSDCLHQVRLLGGR
jgi:site-specific DNA recombinase